VKVLVGDNVGQEVGIAPGQPIKLTAVTFDNLPVQPTGLPSTTSLGKMTDITFDGVNVTNLTRPLLITMPLDPATLNRAHRCMYWNPTLQALVELAVVAIDLIGMQIVCASPHLTMFIIASDSATTVTGAGAAGQASLTTGTIAGITVGAVVLIGVVVGIILSRKNAARSTGSVEDGELPLTALEDQQVLAVPNTRRNRGLSVL
jgi:hypothetical protein